MASASRHRGRPLVFGEVLFDLFPDGHAVLGGAPFNVAWHLQGLGREPRFYSRVGNDANGERVLAAMGAWGMDTRGLQQDPDHPTGEVRITMAGPDARFEILPDQAYDHIDGQAVLAQVRAEPPSLIYHGSLIARGVCNRRTLADLVEERALPAFVDVNLRAPWWEPGTVTEIIEAARWLKLNAEELAALEPESNGAELDRAIAELRDLHDLDLVVLTLGAEGAVIATPQECVRERPPPTDAIVDTVGAGDAFSAVVIYGLEEGWPTATTLRRALAFGSDVCRIRGATSTDRGLYERHLESWSRSDR